MISCGVALQNNDYMCNESLAHSHIRSTLRTYGPLTTTATTGMLKQRSPRMFFTERRPQSRVAMLQR